MIRTTAVRLIRVFAYWLGTMYHGYAIQRVAFMRLSWPMHSVYFDARPVYAPTLVTRIGRWPSGFK